MCDPLEMGAGRKRRLRKDVCYRTGDGTKEFYLEVRRDR